MRPRPRPRPITVRPRPKKWSRDMVELALSWQALQSILVVIEDAASKISMSFNTKKTVCI